MKINELKITPEPLAIRMQESDQIFKRLDTLCREFMPIFATRGPLYHGFADGYKPEFIARSRSDRKPKNFTQELQVKIDGKLSEAGFTALRGNSLFCTSSFGQAADYGMVYMIFPIDGFTYTWSNSIADLWWEKSTIEKRIDSMDSQQFVTRYQFLNSDLGRAMQNKHEIYIQGKFIALEYHEYYSVMSSRYNMPSYHKSDYEVFQSLAQGFPPSK